MIMAIHDGGTDMFGLESRLEELELSAHCGVHSHEPVNFLESVAEVSGCSNPRHNGGPSEQDIECLRQAAWKYCRQTASNVATARDLGPVLQRLGYV